MTTEIKPANSPAELTAENREATIAYLRDEVGFPVDTLGATFEHEGLTFVVCGPETAIALGDDRMVNPDGFELNNDSDIETRLSNIAQACIDFKLNFNSLFMSLHTAVLVFDHESLTYSEDDTERLVKVIESCEGGDKVLGEMRLMSMLGIL